MRAMTHSLAAIGMILVGLGCSERAPQERVPFSQRHAVVSVKAGNDNGTSRVEECYEVGEDGQPKRYGGGLGLHSGSLEVRYEFVGNTFCQVDSAKDGWDYADVYVFHIARTGQPTEQLTVIHKGGTTTVVDRPDLRVQIGPDAAPS